MILFIFRFEAWSTLLCALAMMIAPGAVVGLFTHAPISAETAEVARWLASVMVALGFAQCHAFHLGGDEARGLVVRMTLVGDVLFTAGLAAFASGHGAWTPATVVVVVSTMFLAVLRVLCLLDPRRLRPLSPSPRAARTTGTHITKEQPPSPSAA